MEYLVMFVGNLFWLAAYKVFDWGNTFAFSITENAIYLATFMVFIIYFKEKFNALKLFGTALCLLGGVLYLL